MKAITNYFQKTTCENVQQREKREKLYEYYPREFIGIDYQALYNEVKYYLRQNNSRKTCVLVDEDDLSKIRKIYNTLNIGFFTPIVQHIKEKLEEKFNRKIGYGLVQYYENGESNISWHNDKEAINSFVLSVSFGSIRNFNMRDINTKKLVDKIALIHGDVFYMKDGFQTTYEHCIPIEKNVNYPRISLTFREFEN